MIEPFLPKNTVKSKRIIYTPSQFARTNLIHLQEVGTLEALKAHNSIRDNLNSFLFFIVLSGSGKLTYNGIDYNLKNGDCVFLNCRNPYIHSSSEDLWTLKWVHFYGSNMTAIYDKYIERGGYCVFRPKNKEEYIILLDKLYEVANSSQYTKDMKIFNMLTNLLTLLMDESWHPQKQKINNNKKYNLNNIKDYIDNNFTIKITLDDLSEKFFINKFYLTRLFKEQYGISVAIYIQQLRITYGKKLLRFTDKSIDEISSICGINDANYFSRIFHKFEDISPSEYRKQWESK